MSLRYALRNVTMIGASQSRPNSLTLPLGKRFTRRCRFAL